MKLAPVVKECRPALNCSTVPVAASNAPACAPPVASLNVSAPAPLPTCTVAPALLLNVPTLSAWVVVVLPVLRNVPALLNVPSLAAERKVIGDVLVLPAARSKMPPALLLTTLPAASFNCPAPVILTVLPLGLFHTPLVPIAAAPVMLTPEVAVKPPVVVMVPALHVMSELVETVPLPLLMSLVSVTGPVSVRLAFWPLPAPEKLIALPLVMVLPMSSRFLADRSVEATPAVTERPPLALPRRKALLGPDTTNLARSAGLSPR